MLGCQPACVLCWALVCLNQTGGHFRPWVKTLADARELGGARRAGKRQCTEQGCSKWTASGGTPHCKGHGGLYQVSSRHHGLVQGAWWGATVSRGRRAVPGQLLQEERRTA